MVEFQAVSHVCGEDLEGANRDLEQMKSINPQINKGHVE